VAAVGRGTEEGTNLITHVKMAAEVVYKIESGSTHFAFQMQKFDGVLATWQA
jgi:hypothetical protein